MNKVFFIIPLFLICSCTNRGDENAKSWDFDHGVQYRQKEINKGEYQLTVISNDNVRFNRLATFLLRQSYKVCGQYGFTLKVLSGIEDIDDRKVSPSHIQPSLSANLTCPKR